MSWWACSGLSARKPSGSSRLLLRHRRLERASRIGRPVGERSPTKVAALATTVLSSPMVAWSRFLPRVQNGTKKRTTIIAWVRKAYQSAVQSVSHAQCRSSSKSHHHRRPLQDQRPPTTLAFFLIPSQVAANECNTLEISDFSGARFGTAPEPINTGEAPSRIRRSPSPSDEQEEPPVECVGVAPCFEATKVSESKRKIDASRKRRRPRKGTTRSEAFVRSCKEPAAPYALLVRPKNTRRKIPNATIIGQRSFEGLGASLNAVVRDLPQHLIEFLKSKSPTRTGRFDTVVQHNQSRSLKHYVVEKPLDGPLGQEFHLLLVEMTATCLGESHPAIQRLRVGSLACSEHHQSTTRSSQEAVLKYLYSMLLSTETNPQHSHRDYTHELLDHLAPDQAALVAFFFLTEAGTWLQLWDDKGLGSLVFCPWGRIVVLLGNTVHGGGFKSHSNGNLRGHLYLFVNATPLTKNDLITNYEPNLDYEPANCIRDLCPFYS